MKVKFIGTHVDHDDDGFENHFKKKYSNRITNGKSMWNDVEFIPPSGKETEYDFVIVLNTPEVIYQLNCPKQNIFAIMQEPGYRKYHTFMYRELTQYAHVFSPVKKSENTCLSHGYLGWSTQKCYSEFRAMTYEKIIKNKLLSSVTSNLEELPGRIARVKFLKTLAKEIDFDWFGRGVNPINDKWDGLTSYKYSIAVENSSIPHYFTEKINDCFLAYTIPFYYGCTNIHDYFPKNSYIWIDIERPQYAIDKIKDIIQNENPEDRKNDLIEARERVLEKYHLGAAVDNIVSSYYVKQNKSTKKARVYPIRHYSISNVIKLFLMRLSAPQYNDQREKI